MGGRQTRKRKLYPAIAIVGEGITESIYFSQMRQQEDLQFTVKPDMGKNSGVDSIVSKALDLLEKEYDKVFCAIDMDELVRDATLMRKYKKLRKEHDGEGLVFIETHPCTEFWFLLHYVFTTKPYTSYSQLQKELRKHLPSYEKTERYLAGNNIYKQLKPNQPAARSNAEKTVLTDAGNSRSEIHKILDYLGVK